MGRAMIITRCRAAVELHRSHCDGAAYDRVLSGHTAARDNYHDASSDAECDRGWTVGFNVDRELTYAEIRPPIRLSSNCASNIWSASFLDGARQGNLLLFLLQLPG